MDVTINYKLKQLASELFIKYNSTERQYISDRILIFQRGIKTYFGSEISSVEIFGSYKRDTILPRYFDDNSDIDVLVIFNTSQGEYKTETYRNQLLRFADSNYSKSTVLKDFPSVVLELKDIKFDLVPCIYHSGFISSYYQIPDSDGDWMETDPGGFNKTLTEANKDYGGIVKPLIRVFKRWNAYNNYVYDSYKLEQIIADMNLSGDNYQSGFFYIIDELPTWRLSSKNDSKVKSLRNRRQWIEEYLDRGDQNKAFEHLYAILGLKY